MNISKLIDPGMDMIKKGANAAGNQMEKKQESVKKRKARMGNTGQAKLRKNARAERSVNY
tara:strand:+ start:2321 stop:2500 length:180 start_codon:yes stop_codon:yes gene_type:complete